MPPRTHTRFAQTLLTDTRAGRATTVVRFFRNEVAIPIPDPDEEGAVQLLPYSAFPEALQREWIKKSRMSFKVLCNVSDSHFASIVRKMNIGTTMTRSELASLQLDANPTTQRELLLVKLRDKYPWVMSDFRVRGFGLNLLSQLLLLVTSKK